MTCNEGLEPVPCLIVGGGPAGLTAGIYLARFRRRLRLFDTGASRTSWIPRSHNLPGFPKGVRGEDLLCALRQQFAVHHGVVEGGKVEDLRRGEAAFTARVGAERIQAETVLLATGVVETVPAVPHVAEAVRLGKVRVCPICDGFEVQGRSVAVLGSGDHAAREALFLRTWATEVAVVLSPEDQLSPELQKALAIADAPVLRASLDGVALAPDEIRITTFDGASRQFDLVYAAFGVTPQVDLARNVGARLDPEGRLQVNQHQETTVPGLFAAGDIVRGLNQIAVAEGEAAVAATAIHNRLPPNIRRPDGPPDQGGPTR
jgi:thioredoxin reductase (NADPH)